MYNTETDIIVDLRLGSKNPKSLKPEYYKLCIENMIDTLNEGSDCLYKKHYRVIFLIEENKDYENYIPEKIGNYNIDFKKENYDTIYNLIKEMKYIILGDNIISYFALKENRNSIEDMIVIAFEFFHIQNSKSLEKSLKYKDTELYVDSDKKLLKGNIYIKNPLLKTEYILISDLNLRYES